jgi:benzoyl-CoA reductase/2-hydroxyglutaryl-CoA dehydratase subunit BcrC/BadD/HgdB
MREALMSQDYRTMWSGLGIDLAAHDLLMEALGQSYGNTFLSQQNRPEGMKYFDFVMSEVHGLRIREILDAKEAGRKVIGSFCVFVPEELVLAVDGVSIGLCTGAEFAKEEVDKILPRNICALIKSAFGFAVSHVCPFILSSDMIVGEYTCDGKKKAYELFGGLVKNFYAMDLPQKKTESGRRLLKEEYLAFAKALEDLSGRKITVEGLRKAIDTVNAKRSAMHRLAGLRAAVPAPISGLDALLANQVFFYDDPVRFTTSMNAICDELEGRTAKREGVAGPHTPRIVIAGCPMAVPNWKLHSIIETSGAVVVGEESCVGERGIQFLTDTSALSVEGLIDSIVDRYFRIDCAIFTPNESRRAHIKKIVRDTGAQGVIHYCLQFCTPYLVESGAVAKELEGEGIPTLRIETDYSQEDAGQIRTRVEAFIEMIGRR